MHLEAFIMFVALAAVLIVAFNLEPRLGSAGRIIFVIVAVALIVIILTGCDPNTDRDLEINYGTTTTIAYP